jgi:hypothetical protein
VQRSAQILVAMMASGALFADFASAPAIGIAMASGSFVVNNVEVKGNTTLFDGAAVRTTAASLKFRTAGGARFDLGTQSQADFFTDHAVLRRGAGQLRGARYSLEALGLRIGVSRLNSVARVRLDGKKAVFVSAVGGTAVVTNIQGVKLAEVTPGLPLRFVPQAAGANLFQLSGCLLEKSARIIIVDQTTNQMFELRGNGLEAEIGNRVAVTGTALQNITPVAGASQVIEINTIKQVSPGGCLAVAESVGAEPPPRPTAPVEMAHKSHTAAIVLGVLVAGGAAAGVGIAMSSKNKSQ